MVNDDDGVETRSPISPKYLAQVRLSTQRNERAQGVNIWHGDVAPSHPTTILYYTTLHSPPLHSNPMEAIKQKWRP